MSDHPTVALVKRLRARTAEGKVKWEVTTDESTYQAAFPGYAVTVRERERQQGPNDYFLRIFDSEGAIVEEVNDSDFGDVVGDYQSGLEMLRGLFRGARSAAKGVDKAVTTILNALGADDDDNPF